jgi:hypothetical protein
MFSYLEATKELVEMNFEGALRRCGCKETSGWLCSPVMMTPELSTGLDSLERGIFDRIWTYFWNMGR